MKIIYEIGTGIIHGAFFEGDPPAVEGLGILVPDAPIMQLENYIVVDGQLTPN